MEHEKEKKIRRLTSPILIYLLLILIVLLPFIKNYPSFIAGGDFAFNDFGISSLSERIPYYWQETDGFGGLSIGRYGSLSISFILIAFTKLFATNITQFILIATFYSIAFWGVYCLTNEYSKKLKIEYLPLSGGLLAFFYCTNLFAYNFLKVPTYLFLCFFSFTPLLIYIIIKNIESGVRNIKYFVIFVAIVLLNTYTFINVTDGIIQTFSIVLFLIPFINIKNYKKFIFIAIIFFLLNSPSVIEYFIFLFNSKSIQLAEGQTSLTETAKVVQQSLFNLRYIFGFLSGDIFGQWWNSKGITENFPFKPLYNGSIYTIVLIIPAMLCILTFFYNKKNKIILFFICVFLLNILLVSMYGFSPLSAFWNKFYEIPAASIFRNSTKFWIPLILSADILLLYLFSQKRRTLLLFGIYLIFLNFYSLSGYVFKEDTFVNPPYAYTSDGIKEAFSHINEEGVGIVYPAKDFFLYGYNWGYVGYSPLLLLQNKIPLLHKGGEALSLSNSKIYGEFKDQSLINLTTDDFIQNNVKYVFFHKDVNYKVFNYIDNSEEVRGFLDSHFEIVFENINYVIYKTFSNLKPTVLSRGSVVQKINPTKYQIHVSSAKNMQDLTFLESYNSQWKLYLEKQSSLRWGVSPTPVNNEMLDNPRKRIFYQGDEMKYLWTKPIFEESHSFSAGYINKWNIDPNYIRRNFSKEYYKENPDGSIDIELTLYFKSQSYFYLGIMISIATLTFCLCYIIYIWRKNNIKLIKNGKNNH